MKAINLNLVGAITMVTIFVGAIVYNILIHGVPIS